MTRQLLNIENHQQVFFLAISNLGITRAKITHDTKYVVYGTGKGDIKVFDLEFTTLNYHIKDAHKCKNPLHELLSVL